MNDFIITATSLQKVSNELVHKCFTNAQYELSVCAAEDGSFKDWFIGVLMGEFLSGVLAITLVVLLKVLPVKVQQNMVRIMVH